MTPQKPSNIPLDFVGVEALRKHMLLNTEQMAKSLGVSRVTYSGWVKGKTMRKANADKVRAKLREMLSIVTDQNWPKPEVIAMPSTQRFDTLLELMNQEQ